MMKWTYAGGLLAVVAVAACKPMYGAAPEKLAKPKIPVDKTLKPDPKPQPPAKPELIADCSVDMHRPNDKVVRKKSVAQQRLQEGDTERVRAEKETDKAERARHARRSLVSYSDALVADPYHAEATLMLAVAYDMFRYKGCALRVLERIGTMRGNPSLEREAMAAADRVRSNPQWFAEYRTEAMNAVVSARP